VKIYVSNRSTVLSDTTIKSWMPAFQRYTEHVRAYWPRPVTLQFVSPADVPANVWRLDFIDDDSQVAGALGYHDYTPGMKPISYVFAKTDKIYGYNPTVTATHELAEMMADPYINDLIQVTDTKLYAKEIADPCEADKYGYDITVPGYAPVTVSDFVTPAWFIPGHPGPVYDWNRKCTRPLQIISGGYMSIYVSGEGWTQVTARGTDVPMNEKGEHSRPARYARSR
jgi:hypothetical protein